jgi:hypothetical protein
MKPALLVAVQVQPPCAVTVTLPGPPVAVKDWVAGKMVSKLGA